MIRKLMVLIPVIAVTILATSACTTTNLANGRGSDSHAGHSH